MNETDNAANPDNPIDTEEAVTPIAELAVDKPDAGEETAVPPYYAIAGFWRRFFAFVVDGIIISIPLLIIGFGFRNIAFRMGPYGRILGAVIIIAYWTVFHSEYGEGQTLGKRLLKITVIDKNNQYLSLKKSFVRAVALELIFLLNGWSLPLFQNPIIGIVVTMIVLVGVLLLFYGLVFNRKTRQGPHDLLVGSYVINSLPVVTNAVPPPLPKIHRRFIIGLAVIAVLVSLAALAVPSLVPALNVVDKSEWNEIQDLYQTLSQRDDAFLVGVNRVNRTFFGGGGTLRDLNIQVWLKTPCSQNQARCDEVVKEIARTVFAEYDNVENLDGMRITVYNRFELGIANGTFSQGAELRMEDWQALLEE
ncbi:MAG TPA: RDD family protein [Anaerolineae bacterium]|nr:RDD family protein [Anaerolineae bacterium]HIP70675.1 RDD family protein [Anaerolineae bacterium]